MPVNTRALTPEEIKALFDSPGDVPPNTFEIGLVLGGTVSAGAYTAGAMDFLIEALDNWTRQRDAGAAVPRHKAIVRIITGTSGGSVNAAIAARALAFDFPHVSRGTPPADATRNPFYQTWIHGLNLDAMLQTEDLDGSGSSAVSLLNGKAIDKVADELIRFSTDRPAQRSWLARPLRVMLTMTNLNGIPYRIDFGQVPMPGGSMANLQECYVDHADHARFAIVYPNQASGAPRPDEMVLSFGNQRLEQAIDWASFGQYACGSAAFPIGFPPRRLTRPLEHYRYRVVGVPVDTPDEQRWRPLVPDWDAIQTWAGGGLPDDYQFLVVDGGATNNEPIELARTALAGVSGRNPRSGVDANRGVVLIDPFAGAAKMAPPVTLKLPDLVESLVGAMLQQTRYDTRDLLLAAQPDVFSRFMITALRENHIGDPALATAGMGAFIGFACEAFRRHDYLLGRKNCQDYLRSMFVLPENSPVFAGCLNGVALDDYRVTDDTGTYLPIIPLVGESRIPETLDPWPRGALNPEIYRDPVEHRFSRLLHEELASGPLSSVLTWLVTKIGQDKVSDALVTAMQEALTTWKLV